MIRIKNVFLRRSYPSWRYRVRMLWQSHRSAEMKPVPVQINIKIGGWYTTTLWRNTIPPGRIWRMAARWFPSDYVAAASDKALSIYKARARLPFDVSDPSNRRMITWMQYTSCNHYNHLNTILILLNQSYVLKYCIEYANKFIISIDESYWL